MDVLLKVADAIPSPIANSYQEDKDKIGKDHLVEKVIQSWKQTFCSLYFRNFIFYVRNVRNTSFWMAMVTAILQIAFFYQIGDMEEPPASVFTFIAMDTWVVASTFQTIMTIRSMELFEREKKVLRMRYSTSSFFLAHWFSSFMALKIYGVVSCTIAFWIIALPKPKGLPWFNFFCMELVLTMCAISLGQMLGIIFKSTKRALIVLYFITLYSIICSGSLMNIKTSTNVFFTHMSHFSPLRFATEEMMRQIMESNEHPNTDGYLESFDYIFKIQDYPFITDWSIIFFCTSWILIVLKVREPKPKQA